MKSHRLQLISATIALMVLLSACGPVVTTTSTIKPTTTTTPTTLPAPSTTAVPQSITTVIPSTTTTAIESTLKIGNWEGELVESGPHNGDTLMVVGVHYNDVLNVREGPGSDFPVVTVLEPDTTNIAALGMTWLLPGSAWYAVSADGVQGWASGSFLLQPGDIVDITIQVVERLGAVPQSGSLIDLGLIVADAMASEEPASSIEQPARVVVGEVGEMIVDVVGLGDDAVGGFRPRVVAHETDGTWVLDRVEARLLCIRGVDEGRCV